MKRSPFRSIGFRSFAGSRGFSMVELLVVAAIVSILVSLLLPSISSMKKRSKTLVCLKNMREIGSAMMLYAAEQGGFPYSSHYNYWADWGESLVPYMTPNFYEKWAPGEPWANGLPKLKGTFQHLAHEVGQGSKNKYTGTVTFQGYPYFSCPEAPASKGLVPPWDGNWIHCFGHNYSANEYLMPSNHNGNYVGGMPIPRVRPENIERPGSLILVCDAGVNASEFESYDTLVNAIDPIIVDFVADPEGASTRGETVVGTPSVNNNDLGPGSGWPIYSRHNGVCVTLMADGHVESFRNGQMKRRNFVSKGVTKRWGGAVDYVRAYYP